MLYYLLLIILLAFAPTKDEFDANQSKTIYDAQLTIIADDNDDADDVKSA